MQPEDIIQAKEWQQLTEAEMALLQPLAATEGEYNVLKRMLLIVQEDEVPQLSPDIHTVLHQHLAKPTRRQPKILWYAAAASVLVLLITTIFLWPGKKADNIAITPRQSQPTLSPLSQRVLPVDSVLILQPTPVPGIVKAAPLKKPSTHLQTSTNKPAITTSDVASINTEVGHNTALLSFVTEVY